MSNKQKVSVRIDAEDLKILDKEAQSQARSRSNLIQIIFKQYLESIKQK